jgi:uncharacterized RDD family membrane protein YckC
MTVTEWSAPDPEGGPAPGVEFGSPGSRLVGYIVDMIVQFGLSLALLLGAGILGAIFVPLGALAFVAGIVFLFIYFPFFWVRSGQTPGMRLTGIKVVRDKDGGPVGWGSAFLRLIGYWISAIVFYIGFIWIFIDKRKRGWYDLMAGTCVIKVGGDLTSG